MTEGTSLPAPLTRVEQLTAQFYDWERRGRGWTVWPVPVDLEPPFRPFFYQAPAPATPRHDDGRRPTLLSRFVESLTGGAETSGPPVVQSGWIEEPEPAPVDDAGSLVELHFSLPLTLKISKEAAERFLLALPVATGPVAFEVVGTAEAIAVQLTVNAGDALGLRRQALSYFPETVLLEREEYLKKAWKDSPGLDAYVVDFGLSQEFMRPLHRVRDFNVDPLIGLTGALEVLESGEVGVCQILFQPTRYPWGENVGYAVTDWEGKSFFLDAPEMVPLAREKVARPLFAAVLRIGAKSRSRARTWEILRALGGALRAYANPPSNELIPLSNEGYPDEDHEEDLLARRSRRSGMLLNSEELVSFVHPPSASVRSERLTREREKTRSAPVIATGHAYVLGENEHAGATSTVSASLSHRLRHAHVVGATGTGKSHFLMQGILQDLEQGHGLAVFDPHGDLIDQALGYVPEERLEDVVVVDPSDAEFPVGFNVLEARTEIEKTLLASDLVAVFQRLSTSWGDQMTAILGNAVLAFLESPRSGTILDLRRFLVDPAFRDEILPTVTDSEVLFFFEHEFPQLRKNASAPILTRLNAFLRPKPIRYMVGQRTGLDLAEIMDSGKILLVKLSHGLVGQENAHLLGALLVSKLQQLALARQAVESEARRPFFLYVDEFHHFATPSMATLLTSARKYKLGLVLAHQDLRQLGRDEEIAAAVLANPAIRLAFRVSEQDARKLAEGFASFDAEDLTRLGVGEAICRIERSDLDFNLKTLPLPEIDPKTARERRERILERSRERYGTPREEIEATIQPSAPSAPKPMKQERTSPSTSETPPEAPESPETAELKPAAAQEPVAPKPPPAARKAPPATPGKGGPQHVYLQTLIQRWASSRGWRVTIEKEVLGGLGRADVALEREDVTVACEVTVTTTPEHELANVQKCLAAGFNHVVVVSAEAGTLRKAKRVIAPNLEEAHRDRVHFLTPEALFAFLEEREAESEGREETVRGYTVKTKHKAVDPDEKEQRKKAVGKVILDAVKRLRK